MSQWGGIEAAMRFLSSNSIKYTNPKWGIQWDVYLATIILELECLGFAWKMMSINLINGWIYGTCCGKPWFVPPILPVSCGFSTLCGMALKNPSQKHARHGGSSSKSKYCFFLITNQRMCIYLGYLATYLWIYESLCIYFHRPPGGSRRFSGWGRATRYLSISICIAGHSTEYLNGVYTSTY